MERNKTPIKYTLNVWKMLPGYPTADDALYEIMQHMSRKGMTEFSVQTLNGVWYDQSGVANWEGTQFEVAFKELLANGTVAVARTEDKTGKQWYKINDPWT